MLATNSLLLLQLVKIKMFPIGFSLSCPFATGLFGGKHLHGLIFLFVLLQVLTAGCCVCLLVLFVFALKTYNYDETSLLFQLLCACYYTFFNKQPLTDGFCALLVGLKDVFLFQCKKVMIAVIRNNGFSSLLLCFFLHSQKLQCSIQTNILINQNFFLSFAKEFSY